MTSSIRSLAVAAGIMVLAAVQNASAQIDNAVEFTTSFPFTVGSTTVPAGSYTIKPDDDSPQLLELSGAGVHAFFETNNAQAREMPSKTEVVFKRYGDRYVLKNIWLDSSDTGYETIAGEGERHMVKQYGSATEHRLAARKVARTTSKR
jgi:hypothetical protein